MLLMVGARGLSLGSVEIRDLDYFLACCKAGSFTAAAREVHIVQSAMSSAIARLEHELGVSLFDRSATPVTVTGPGAALQGGRLSPLAGEPLVFDCPDGHPLGGRSRVTVADLAAQTILRFPPGWGVRAAVDAVLGPSPAAIEIADYALMLKLIRDGFGTTLLPASALSHGHPGLLAV